MAMSILKIGSKATLSSRENKLVESFFLDKVIRAK
jgi:hypothetical protein